MNKIELLDTKLLNNSNILEEIDKWLKIFGWTNGWHYDLDIIWVLKELESLNLKQGATILDAGAGLGMMQFILASRGYNVISLDFTDREIPKNSIGIFEVNKIDNKLDGYTHEYMEYMTYGVKKHYKLINILKLGGKAILNPLKAIKYINKKVSTYLYVNNERKKEHTQFGKITFLRGTFNNIPMDNNSADALISISAFEHNSFEDMKSSVLEFSRVIRDESFMFITTSAKDKTWYQKASKGWCFDKDTLSDFFRIDSNNIEFNYKEKKDKIINSKILKDRLGEYYKHPQNLTIPNGLIKYIEYIPVGIKRKKLDVNKK